MPNPYPATFEVAENLHVRLDGDVTFTDPANQPGGGGGGQVNSVTAGDASITIAGTVTDPTVAVAALGVTSGKIASNAVTQAKLAAKAVGAAEMDSGAASANWVPVADGTGGVVYAASPGVNSLTAADASVVVGGTASSPTVRTGTLDTIATQHPPTAAVALNSQQITGLANGTLASHAAAFGQIPTALPPNGSAGGDLSGTYPNPTVAAVQGVAVSGTAPTAGQVLTASDATHAAWATGGGGGLGTDGWNTISATLTYSSADAPTFVASTSVDLTGTIGVGARVKLTQTTVKFFVVTAIDASTITLYGGTDYTLANAAISSPSWSPVKDPVGFTTDPAKWTVEVLSSATPAKASPTAATWYGGSNLSPTGPSIDIPIGAWRVYYETGIGSRRAAAGSVFVRCTLSTSTSSESDSEFTTNDIGIGNTTAADQAVHKERFLTLAAKTTYYLALETTAASQTSILINSQSQTNGITIRAICAYL